MKPRPVPALPWSARSIPPGTTASRAACDAPLCAGTTTTVARTLSTARAGLPCASRMLAHIFAVDVADCAVMSNHYHVDSARAQQWSTEQVMQALHDKSLATEIKFVRCPKVVQDMPTSASKFWAVLHFTAIHVCLILCHSRSMRLSSGL